MKPTHENNYVRIKNNRLSGDWIVKKTGNVRIM